MTEEKQKKQIGIVAISFVAVFIWAVIPSGVYWVLTGGDLGKSGQFGDMFGTVNALFSGLAFAAIAWTMTLQQRQIAVQMEQLKLQREEMALQRKEMKESRGELAKQAKAQEAQTQVSIAQVRAAAYGAAIELKKLEAEYMIHDLTQDNLKPYLFKEKLEEIDGWVVALFKVIKQLEAAYPTYGDSPTTAVPRKERPEAEQTRET